MTTMPLRRVLVLVGFFAALCLTLIVLDRSSLLDPVRTGMDEAISPITSSISGALDRSESDSDLERQLAEVSDERDALQAENAQLKADTAELERLRQEQDAERRYPNVELVEATVLNHDPTGSQMFLTIQVGSNDGIREGMAVVSPYFYVGQVVEVKETTSKVMLIIDGGQSVGAMLQDTRGEGVVNGQWQTSGGYLTMHYVDPSKAPKEGEWVVTSESTVTQTRQVPPNILIGQVVGEPVVNPQTNSLEIQVQPGVGNFSTLTTVYVAVEIDD